METTSMVYWQNALDVKEICKNIQAAFDHSNASTVPFLLLLAFLKQTSYIE